MGRDGCADFADGALAIETIATFDGCIRKLRNGFVRMGCASGELAYARSEFDYT